MREVIALSAAGLVAGYGSHRHTRPVLSVGRIEARHGELVTVVGPNGSGKSTLLRTLVGAQRPLAGTIELGGTPLDRLDRAERARQLAVVLTDRIDAGLLSVGEVIALGRHPHTNWRGHLRPDDLAVAEAAAERLGVGGLWARRFAELSDGQRQRVLVARALTQEPSVLVLDEPTAFLDISGRVELTSAVAALAHVGGLAVILSTHDLDLAMAHADSVWLVHEGGLVTGTPEALVFDGSLAAAFDNDLVALDVRTGVFRARTAAGRPIVVPSPLLGRLVARLGATPLDADVSVLGAWRIEAEGSGWTLHTDSGRIAAGSIDELAELLRRRLAELPGGVSPAALR